MVAPPQAMPVAQVRQTAPPAQRSAPNPARPQPQAPRPPAKAATKAGDESGGMAVAMIAGVIVLGVALLAGGFYFAYGVLKKRQMAEKGLGSEIQSQLEAKREAQAKAKRQEADEKAAVMAALRKMLADQISGGNEKVSGEILREVESIMADADKLYADADVDNDPEDIRVFLAEHMESRLRANPVLFNWLGGRVTPKAFCAMLFGLEQESRQERGKVADFLVAGNYSATGTGFFISSQGWLLTNEHVVHEATEVDVRGADGVILHAQVVKADADGDVAVLKTKEPAAHWLPVAAQEGSMGAAVFTIGFPDAGLQGVEPKFTDGRISSLSGLRDDPDHYQITVPAQPGNSGGPLVDVKTGAVTGIVAAILRGRENVTYAIKSRVALNLLKGLPAYSSATPVQVPAGADMETLASQVRAATVFVMVRK
ncbi:S1C family serine protease [Prosthecobacter fluviatilis]|uniref:S1C family serine protease n=1 Tax=Prosthecobacter fluviatilis TaxID=445931 RepID=A0ABW0KQ98_9BACT